MKEVIYFFITPIQYELIQSFITLLECRFRKCHQIYSATKLVFHNDVANVKIRKSIDFRLFGLTRCFFLMAFVVFGKLIFLGWLPLVIYPLTCFVTYVNAEW